MSAPCHGRSSVSLSCMRLWFLLLLLLAVSDICLSSAFTVQLALAGQHVFGPRPHHGPTRPSISFLQSLPLPSALSSSSENANDDTTITTIQVFDNVFSQETCQDLLHPLAMDHAERCVSSVFYRTTNHDKNNDNNNDNNSSSSSSSSSSNSQLLPLPFTPLEVILDRLLTALEDDNDGDNTNSNNNNSKNVVVEYWSRQQHLHMDVHCDVDEGQLEQEETIRYPSYSHVLYLNLPPKNSEQQQHRQLAPTCVFTNRTALLYETGDGTTNSTMRHGDDVHVDENASPMTTHLVTIPAVIGRLLRFPGNLLHAVPKPYDKWLLSSLWREQNGRNEYDDDDDDESLLRSVLLFNTWQEEGPIDVDRDTFGTATIPDGIEMDEDMMVYLAQEQATIQSDWERDFGVDFDTLRCNPRREWVDCHPVGTGTLKPNTHMSEVRMGLMGNENRRLTAHQQVSLCGSSSDVRMALEQNSLVSKIQLERNK